MPEIQQTPCHVREVAWLQSHLACDRCSQAAPAVWSAHRTCGAYLRDPGQLHLIHIHLRHPSIRVMETAQNRQGNDLALAAKRAT